MENQVQITGQIELYLVKKGINSTQGKIKHLRWLLDNSPLKWSIGGPDAIEKAIDYLENKQIEDILLK